MSEQLAAQFGCLSFSCPNRSFLFSVYARRRNPNSRHDDVTHAVLDKTRDRGKKRLFTSAGAGIIGIGFGSYLWLE